MIGEMASLKQGWHRDDVKSSGPQETDDSFSHSFPHFMHFTRNFFVSSNTLRSGSFYLLILSETFFQVTSGLLKYILKKGKLVRGAGHVKHILWLRDKKVHYIVYEDQKGGKSPLWGSLKAESATIGQQPVDMNVPFERMLQAFSKIHLTPNYGVASLFKMLTYSHVCCAFSSARALSLNVICIFEIACSLTLYKQHIYDIK
jgi:hypothetical protein